MSREFQNQGSAETLAQLPKGADAWAAQLEAERSQYERMCKEQGRQFDPGENLYGQPQIPFGPYFIHLSEINSSMSPRGAFYLYETLRTVPEGYSYHGNVEDKRVSAYARLGAVVIGGGLAHDLDGNIMDGYVSIAVQKSALGK